MPFHLRANFRQSRITRIAVGTTVLAVALAVQYQLTKIPSHSIDIAGRSEFSPATIKQSQQQFVIDGPVVASPEGKLFSRDPGPNEVVDVHFDNARVDEQTVEDLSNPTVKSSSPEPIDYVAAESRERSLAGEPCRTSLEVEFKDAKPPLTLYFYQMEAAGARSVAGRPLPSVYDLKIGSDNLQIRFPAAENCAPTVRSRRLIFYNDWKNLGRLPKLF